MPLQVVDGKTGYVVNTAREMVDRLTRLLQDPALADQMELAGHEHVREHFLVTRALATVPRALRTAPGKSPLHRELAAESSGQGRM